MRTIISVIFVTGILFSCQQPGAVVSVTKAPVDSLINNWCKSWNEHDSAAVQNLFLPDALLIDDDLIATNVTDLSGKWIQKGINVVNNLKATKLQEWSEAGRAGYTGTYQLDVIVNDSVIAKPAGVFSVNWLKTTDGQWKITTATIHSFTKKS